jgi:membrane protease YdiL (CAAX protease family)
MNTFNSTIFSKTILSLGVLVRMAGFFLIMQAIGEILLLQLIDIPADFALHPEKLALIPNIQVILAGVQGFAMFVGFIVLPLLVLKFSKSTQTPTDLFQSVPNQTWLLLASAILLVISLPLAEQFALLNKHMSFPDFLKSTEELMNQKEKTAAILTNILVQYAHPSSFLLVFVVMSIIPAIGEELVFRGIVQNELIKIGDNKHFAIWASAFVFSFIHFQFFGFIPRMLLGGYCYLWTNSLWVPIAMHFVNNALTLVITAFFKTSLLNASQQEDTTFDIRFFIPYIVAQAVFLFVYYKFVRKQQIKV